MEIHVNEQRVTQLLGSLVKIESINPTLVPGGSGEMKVASFLVDYLKENGIEAKLQIAAKGRPNAIGILRGTGGGKTLLMDAHLDTTSVEGMEDPFSGFIWGGKVFGRGAGDDKGGVAAAMEALIALKESGLQLAGDVIVAGVADEEYGSIGTEMLVKEYKADACIIGEPSRLSQGLNLGIGVGSGGYLWAEIAVAGKAAHGSLYDVGIDAIEHMGSVLQALTSLKKSLLNGPPYSNPLATFRSEHRPSIHASQILGGTDLATYPDSCLLSLERRMVFGESFEKVKAELEELLAYGSNQFPGFQATLKVIFERAPWEAQPGPLLEILEAEVTKELGFKPQRYAIAGWNDGAITSLAGIPTLVFGPNGDSWHAPGEYAETEGLVRCARAMARTAAQFCR
jgi:acetylornithine deacetylase